MCLAVPMTIVEVKDDHCGVVELQGVRRPVRLELLDDPSVGDIVIVHAGYAIERLDQAEADARLELFEKLARHYAEGTGKPVRFTAEPESKP